MKGLCEHAFKTLAFPRRDASFYSRVWALRTTQVAIERVLKAKPG